MARKRVLVLDTANHNEPVGLLLVPQDRLDELAQIEYDWMNENYTENGDSRWETLSDLLKDQYPKITFVDFDGEFYLG